MVTHFDYDHFEKSGLTDPAKKGPVLVTKYYLHEGLLPNEDQTYSFAIPLMEKFAGDSAFVERNITEKMKIMENNEILPKGSWEILPQSYKDREAGIPRPVRYIKFKDSVDKKAIALTESVSTWATGTCSPTIPTRLCSTFVGRRTGTALAPTAKVKE